jgi:formate dehydrogenase subunit delta
VDAHKLVKMANEIGSFFASDPDRQTALDGVAGHLRRFWDPRMRKALLAWVDDNAGAGLTPLVLEAIRANRAMLAPPAAPDPRAAGR